MICKFADVTRQGSTGQDISIWVKGQCQERLHHVNILKLHNFALIGEFSARAQSGDAAGGVAMPYGHA